MICNVFQTFWNSTYSWNIKILYLVHARDQQDIMQDIPNMYSKNYTQVQHLQRFTIWSIIKSAYVTLWYIQFRLLRVLKRGHFLFAWPRFSLIELNRPTQHWLLSIHWLRVPVQPYLGHDNSKWDNRGFPIIKSDRHIYNKKTYKFSQIYIAFAFRYA